MEPLNFFKLVAGFVIAYLSVRYQGLGLTLLCCGIIAAGIAVYRLRAVHMSANAAEIALSTQALEWRSSTRSRLGKREERIQEFGLEVKATVAALLAPAARYNHSLPSLFSGSMEAGASANGELADDRYQPLLRQADGSFRRENPALINVLVVKEAAAAQFNFRDPASALTEKTEADRKKASTRKAYLRLNAMLYSMLYHAGPESVRAEIDKQRRQAARAKASEPDINVHLRTIANRHWLIVWIGLRLFGHPSNCLAFETAEELTRGREAMESLQRLS